MGVCNEISDVIKFRVISPTKKDSKEKKRVHGQAVRRNVTPIVLSVDGLLHREVEHFLKRIAGGKALYSPNVWIC